MLYRQAVIHDAETMDADKDFTIDLNGLQVISGIGISVKFTNNGDTPTAHPAKLLTSIKIVDGSDVLYSCSGIQAQAIEYYNLERVPYVLNSWYDDQIGTCIFYLPFGRWLWDELLALDPARFKNLQLKFSYDEDGGGSAPDAGQVEVFAYVFDQQMVNPIGFLMHKEQYGYSLSSSGWETIDLPIDYPIRGITIQSLFATKQPYEQYNEVKLSENMDQHIVFENKTSDLMKFLANSYPKIIENHEGNTSTSVVTHYCMPGYNEDIVISSMGATATYPTITKTFGGTFGVKANAAAYFCALASGFAPHGAMWLALGKHNEPEKWFNPTPQSVLKLKIKGGSAVGSSSTCEILTTQLRKY